MAQDGECDVLVVGSGGGGLVGTLLAAVSGLRTIMIEKTALIGGTTAYSGGGSWIPNNPVVLRAGVPDTFEIGQEYMRLTVGDRVSSTIRDAYLRAGPEMVGALERLGIEFVHDAGYPDYQPELPGGRPLGRTIIPAPFDPRRVGDDLDHVRLPLTLTERTPLPEQGDVAPLTAGQALVGRLLTALREAGGSVYRNTGLESLVVEDGAVVGADVVSDGVPHRIGVRRAVLLAAGGFERNAALRRAWQPGVVARDDWTLGAPANTGDAITAAMAVGAATDLMEDAWWTPVVVRPDGSVAFLTAERAFPGGMIVNGAGYRYANESHDYNTFGHEMLWRHTPADPHIPSWFITDQRFFDRYPFAGLPPGTTIPETWFETGALCRADTLEELAVQIGVLAGPLYASVEEFSGFARTGVDARYGRGESAYDRNLLVRVAWRNGITIEREWPNPCLAPIDTPPYYAAPVVLGDIGTKGGLVCDEHARVLDGDGRPIRGLYATGNCMASVMGHAYPGPGSTIGPSMTFAYVAVQDVLAGDGAA